jgi:hypothetical protein
MQVLGSVLGSSGTGWTAPKRRTAPIKKIHAIEIRTDFVNSASSLTINPVHGECRNPT